MTETFRRNDKGVPYKDFVSSAGTQIALISDSKFIIPALDVNPNNKLFLTLPLPTIKEEIDKRGRKRPKGDLSLYTITSEREMFPCIEEEFMKKNLLAIIPRTQVKKRWSAKGLEEFLESKSPSINPYDLYRRVEDKFTYYIDFSGTTGAEIFSSIYCIGTWFHHLCQYYPYWKLGGIRGSGKSKCGTLAANITFNGKISASETASTIYRWAQDSRGCMIIDESENLSVKSDEYLAYRQVLLSGYASSGMVNRTSPDGMTIDSFLAYNPKIIISIGQLEDTLDDRAFETRARLPKFQDSIDRDFQRIRFSYQS